MAGRNIFRASIFVLIGSLLMIYQNCSYVDLQVPEVPMEEEARK